MSSSAMEATDVLRALRKSSESAEKWVPISFLHETGAVEPLDAAGLWDDACARAAGLAEQGVAPGDKVLLILAAIPEQIRSFLGCLALGAVPAIYPSHPGPDGSLKVGWRRAAELVSSIGVTAVVVGSESEVSAREHFGPRVKVIATATLSDRCGQFAPRVFPAGAPCFIQLTSGSVGLPKAILHDHGRILRHVEAKRVAVGIEPDETIVIWLPLYHDLGLVSGVLTPLVLGIRSILMSPFHWVRNPATLLRAIADHRGTLSLMPNFALAHTARAVRERDLAGVDLSSLRTLLCGAEVVRADTVDEFQARFAPYGLGPTVLRPGYGLAEMVEAATVSGPRTTPRIEEVDREALERDGFASPATGSAARRRMVGCGRPFPGCELRIVGADGRDRPERHVGEVVLRSDCMFDGYLADPSRTNAALRDGWLHTGDLGYVDSGELFFVGRLSDVLVVGGRNISPEDVEALADGIDGLRPGRCVAFSVDDDLAATERAVLVCETVVRDAAARRRIEGDLRRRAVAELDLTLGAVALVEPGWIVKTSSGKPARPLHRARYLDEAGRGGDR